MSMLAKGVQNVEHGNPLSGRSAGGSGAARDVGRLKVIGVVLPLLFIVTVELIRARLVETDIFRYGHLALALFTVVAVVIFSFVMFHLIDRTQTETAQLVGDLLRRKREGHGLYEVLLRISNQDALVDILAAVARNARDLLAGDDAVVWLNDAAARSVQLDGIPAGGTASLQEGACITANAEAAHGIHDQQVACSVRSSPEFKESLRAPIQSRSRALGELWIGRTSPIAFSKRDRQFLTTLSGLASIAVTNARMRESEQLSAVLAERERLAREMHDSLAQVLGVTHLRLRTLGFREDVGDTRATATELNELADFCQQAYSEVREAILDLRESSRTDHGLVDSLRAYLDKYSSQCGIATSLEITPHDEPALAPNSEIQIIRVIQEALTNVRKHSGATTAVVRVAKQEGAATFIVEDNGRGFEPTPAQLDSDRFGLHSMRQRMELIGGTLLIDSAPGRGTRVVAAVPGDSPERIPILTDADGAVNSVN